MNELLQWWEAWMVATTSFSLAFARRSIERSDKEWLDLMKGFAR